MSIEHNNSKGANKGLMIAIVIVVIIFVGIVVIMLLPPKTKDSNIPPVKNPASGGGSHSSGNTSSNTAGNSSSSTTSAPVLQIGSRLFAKDSSIYAYTSNTLGTHIVAPNGYNNYFSSGEYIGTVSAMGAGWLQLISYSHTAPIDSHGNMVGTFYINRDRPYTIQN